MVVFGLIALIIGVAGLVQKKGSWKVNVFSSVAGIFIMMVFAGFLSDSPAPNENADKPAVIEQKEPEKTAEELYDMWLKAQFNTWDGTHIALVSLVKTTMHDPDSFVHVETKYLRLKTEEHVEQAGNGAEIDDVYLYMTFRGRNAFGGKILSDVEALVDKSSDKVITRFEHA